MGPQDHLIRQWREQYARRALRIDFKPLSDTPFTVSFDPIWDDVRVARTRFSAGLTFRDDELVKDGDIAFGVMIAQSRSLGFRHCRRELHLGRGEATLMHVCETGTVGSNQDFAFLSVTIPQLELETRIRNPDDIVMRQVPKRSEGLRLLVGYIRTLESVRVSGATDDRKLISGHIIDLAALSLSQHEAVGESMSNAVVAARVAQVLEHIEGSFSTPDLRIGSVARALRISPRYIQRILQPTGMTFTQHVTDRRLRRAFVMVVDPHGRNRRISDIALEVGFCDLSSFNRLFRARFGDSPSGVRARALRGELSTPVDLGPARGQAAGLVSGSTSA